MVTVYVLESSKNQKRYVGMTTKALAVRLAWHESGLTKWTKQNGPFNIVHSECFATKAEALRREKYFKSGQGRRTLEILISKKG